MPYASMGGEGDIHARSAAMYRVWRVPAGSRSGTAKRKAAHRLRSNGRRCSGQRLPSGTRMARSASISCR